MTVQQLLDELLRLGVTVPEPLRVCLYLKELQDAAAYFRTTLKTELGENYARVAQALQDPGLLSALSDILDSYVVQAISADLQAKVVAGNIQHDFTTYYTTYFLTNYPDDVTAFYQTYVVTGNVVRNLARNFKNNIADACDKITRDWNIIQTVFAGTRGTLTRLLKMKSSGSDFHKGGTQVLILTFETEAAKYPEISSTLNFGFNLIYKPSDLEADCLLGGITEVVNTVRADFQQQSLFELLNALITEAKTVDPLLSLELLPTYKILPMLYGSLLPNGDTGLDIRSSYGYIEFLEHVHYEGYSIFKYYPFGGSDYRIFPTDNKSQICQKFYRIIGQYSAIAATFSLIDLHIENMIVKNYLPHLIDMEICLTSLIDDIGTTKFYGDVSGVSGAQRQGDMVYTEAVSNNGAIKLDGARGPSKYEQNRLWTVRPPALIPPSDALNAQNICRALHDMITVISTGVHNARFDAWQARLRNIIVRVIPVATQEFILMLAAATNPNNCRDVTRLPYIISAKRGEKYEEWINGTGGQEVDPDFLALQDAYVQGDFQNADIPIFYHRIGTTSIMDSSGIKIVITNPISYIDQGGNLQHVNIADLGHGRGTNFYRAPPFQNHIVDTQLAAVRDHPDQRITQLVARILDLLGLAYSPQDVNNILGH